MPRYTTVSAAEALAKQGVKADAFLRRIITSARTLRLTPQRQRNFNSLIGQDSCTPSMLLSDIALRKKASALFFEAISECYLNMDDGRNAFYHITFCDDIGLVPEKTPTLRMAALKRKVDRAIREMGLSAIVMIEIQPLMNYELGASKRALMLHAHALCWGSVSRRKLQAAKKRLNSSRSWSNTFGALPIKTRRLKGGLEDVLKIACYIAKLPHDAKNLVPVVRKSGQRYQFRPTTKGYRNSLALRIAEGLSHYTILDAVFSVGEGKVIRKIWKARLVAWHRERMRHLRARRFSTVRFWEGVNRRRKDGQFQPFTVE